MFGLFAVFKRLVGFDQKIGGGTPSPGSATALQPQGNKGTIIMNPELNGKGFEPVISLQLMTVQYCYHANWAIKQTACGHLRDSR